MTGYCTSPSAWQWGLGGNADGKVWTDSRELWASTHSISSQSDDIIPRRVASGKFQLTFSHNTPDEKPEHWAMGTQ